MQTKRSILSKYCVLRNTFSNASWIRNSFLWGEIYFLSEIRCVFLSETAVNTIFGMFSSKHFTSNEVSKNWKRLISKFMCCCRISTYWKRFAWVSLCRMSIYCPYNWATITVYDTQTHTQSRYEILIYIVGLFSHFAKMDFLVFYFTFFQKERMKKKNSSAQFVERTSSRIIFL